ncbi:MAG: efflux RND transporter periplasmic adaptor subunit [Acidobacteria bacterium]|nr:efflux RND transporter periplasmic adaptor subunit [Acidobacteriota bacterium]
MMKMRAVGSSRRRTTGGTGSEGPAPAGRARSLGLAAVVGLAAVAAACGGATENPPKPAPAVTTVAAAERRVEVALPFTGRVEPAQAVRLVALIAGRVTRVKVADGARVAAGQVLLELGGPQAEAQRRDLAAAADGARQEVAAATARLAQAQRRARSHLAGPGEVTRAEQDAATSRAALAAATAALDRFDAARSVIAPVSGRFTSRRVSPGQDVSSGDSLAEILEPGSLRVNASVMPRAGFEPGTGQQAEIDRDPGSPPLRAVVTAIQPMGRPAGTVQVWLTGKALGSLVPGTAVRGRIVVAVHDHAVTVPTAAIVRDEHDRPLVFVGRTAPYRRRLVATGETGPGWIEITSGLEAGDEVVTAGAYELYWSSFAKTYKAAD